MGASLIGGDFWLVVPKLNLFFENIRCIFTSNLRLYIKYWTQNLSCSGALKMLNVF
jgi:hypothetical protein